MVFLPSSWLYLSQELLDYMSIILFSYFFRFYGMQPILENKFSSYLGLFPKNISSGVLEILGEKLPS